MADNNQQQKNATVSRNLSINKKWLIFAAAIILIICFGVVVFLILNKNEEDSTDANGSDTTIIIEANNRDNTARDYIVNNDSEAAIKVYQKSIDSYNNNKQKADAYIEMAAMLFDYDANKYKQQILEYAYKAEELAPSAKTATFIYDMETNYGNQTAVDEYMTIIKNRTKKDPTEGS